MELGSSQQICGLGQSLYLRRSSLCFGLSYRQFTVIVIISDSKTRKCRIMQAVRVVRESVQSLLTRLGTLLSQNRHSELLVLALVAVYTTVFSYLTIMRYRSLHSSAYDLGIYNQSLYTTVQFGRFFYYTADLPANPSGSIFGVHFLPILVVLLPFYALNPHVETLLIAQSLVLGLGAVPLYFLAKNVTSRRAIGLAFAVVYLTSPLVQGVNWFDFHPEAFIPLGMLTAIYAMQARRWKLYLGGIILTMASLEFAGVIIGVYAATILFESRATIVPLLKSNRILEPGPMALITLAIATAWTGFSLILIRAINQANPIAFGGVSTWSILGATSIPAVPVKALLDPYRAAQALSYEISQKVLYLTLIFAPFIPALSRSVRSVAPTLPWLIVSLLSNFTFYYVIHTQYTAFYIPFILGGSVLGFKSLLASGSLSRRVRKIAVSGMIVGVVLVGVLASPLTAFPLGGIAPTITYGIPVVGEHERLVSSFISMMPPNASVLTQPNLFPLVSNRVDAFLLPYQTYFPPGQSFNSTLAKFLDQSEFVLLDTRTDPVLTSWTLDLLRGWPNYGVYASADGVLLFKRAYHDPPVVFTPVQGAWGAQKLSLVSGTTVRDPDSLQGEVFLHSATAVPDATFWSGPTTLLPPGSYVLTFRMKISSPTQAFLLDLQAVAAPVQVWVSQVWGPEGGYNLRITSGLGPPVIISETRLYGGNFTSAGVYQSFALPFSSSNNAYFDFAGSDVSNGSGLYLDQISLIQTSSSY